MSTSNGDLATVLLVDDTDSKRYVIGSWLRRAGYAVIEAATGSEALKHAAEDDIDVAVLDVHLPDMSGMEVCRTMKAQPRTAAVPVLHVSAIAVEVADRAAGLDRGADAYLTDPIEPQELLSTVRALLRQGQARRKAEHLASRLEQLTIATLRVNVALNAQRLASSAADGAAGMFPGPAAVLLLDEQGGALLATTDGPGQLVTTVGVDMDTARAALEPLARRPTTIPAESHEAWSNLLPEDPDGRWRLAPIRERTDDVVGAIAYCSADERGDDEGLLRQLTQSVAVARENLRVFEAEHRIALTLQRSLLPAALPEVPGLKLSARYRASAEQAEIGGDFFDAFETPDGSIVLAIGDVQGHSLNAAVIMAELRYSLRAYALEGHGPAEVVERLNRLLLHGHPDTTATVCTVTFGPDRSSFTVVNAGHIAPLLVSDEEARYLDVHGVLLGYDAAVPFRPVTFDMPTGSRLLLMTDGLVERRDTPIDTNLDKLAVTVRRHRGDVEALCERLMTLYGHSDDDVALVLAELTGDDA